jgi:deoxyribose-phosphate aldolase
VTAGSVAIENLRVVVEALADLPGGADRFGGPESFCCVVAGLLDQTLLKPEARAEDVRRLCEDAARWGVAAAVVNPCFVSLAAKCLQGTPVHVATVAGFPLGASRPEVKRHEAERALEDGATEVDMVIHVGSLRAGDDAAVEADIRGVTQVCHASGALVKVILEMALLNEEEKRRGALAAVSAGADFVKTSTGFGPGGATVEDVALLRATVGPAMGVKAAGGIRTMADVARMLAAGASRIGTSSGVAILEELRILGA